jgi:hypothetical protein
MEATTLKPYSEEPCNFYVANSLRDESCINCGRGKYAHKGWYRHPICEESIKKLQQDEIY